MIDDDEIGVAVGVDVSGVEGGGPVAGGDDFGLGEVLCLRNRREDLEEGEKKIGCEGYGGVGS